MLKVKNQKTTTVRFLITAIKTKTTNTFFLLVYMLDNMISN